VDRKRRTNPSFLSIDEAARDRRRLENVVRSIAANTGNSTEPKEPKNEAQLNSQNSAVFFSNVGLKGPKGFVKNTRSYSKEYRKQAVCTNIILKQNNIQTKPIRNKPHQDSVKYTKVIGETENFVVQFNFEEGLIEVYGKDFFAEQIFKLRFNSAEAKLIINLLAKARNALGTNFVGRIGEIPRFIVEVDLNEKIVMLYLKDNTSTKLGFREIEVTPLIDYIVEARSLYLRTQ
jgi:hypothetical protein